MNSLPAPVILRAKRERVRLEPNDVMHQGDLLERLGMEPPDDLVEHCARDGVHVFAEDAHWYAEPLRP